MVSLLDKDNFFVISHIQGITKGTFHFQFLGILPLFKFTQLFGQTLNRMFSLREYYDMLFIY